MKPDPEPVRCRKCGRVPRIIMYGDDDHWNNRIARVQCFRCSEGATWSDSLPAADEARRDGVRKWNERMEAARG